MQTAFSSHARFTQLLAVGAAAWIAFAGTIQAQTDADPTTTVTPNVKPGNDQPAAPSPVQATDISQISGAEITKTGNVITGFGIKDCSGLTAADYKLIRQTETLKSLNFAHGPDDAALKILAGMPAVATFTTNGCHLTDAGLATLATFPALQNLTFFHPGKDITGTGLAPLAALPHLESFSVGGSTKFTDPGLATVTGLPHLTGLRFWHTGVTSDGVKALLALKNLQSLTLGQQLDMKAKPTLNDAAIGIVAQLTSLETLTLQEARLGLAALSQLKQLPNLKRLTLDSIDISPADVDALKQQLPKVAIKWTAPTDRRRIDALFGPPAAAPPKK